MMTTNPTGKPVKKTPVKKVPTKKVPAPKQQTISPLIPGYGLTRKPGYETMSGKKGLSIKKAQDGYTGEPGLLERTGPMRKTKTKQRSPDGNYVTKTVTRTRPGGATKSTKTRRSLQGFLQGAPTVSNLTNSNKMKNGGSLSALTASTKRDKGVDPKGAFTKVQKKTLKGAKGKASLTKDKQLGATKMKMGGRMKKC